MSHKILCDLYCLCFSIGCLSILFLAKLPTIGTCYFLLSALIFIAFLNLFLKNVMVLVIGFLLASFLWSTQSALNYLILVERYIDKKITIVAVVKSIKISQDSIIDKQDEHYIDFEIKEIDQRPINNQLTISLLWKNNIIPAAGERWQLRIKTKVVHGNLNQGGFDRQRFAMANRRLLVGAIDEAIQIENTKSFRQQLVDKTLLYADLFNYGDIILALAFGERSKLTSEHKIIMYQTGIAHLMAISGMHIILVVYLVNQLIKGVQFILPIRLIFYWFPLLGGLAVATFYAWLVGLNPPVMRAILALFIWLVLRYYKKSLNSWQVINRIIAILLFFDPLMILSESFWLSCYAVMCLIFIAQWFPTLKKSSIKNSYLWQLLKLQFLLTFLLLPIQFFIFNGISSVAIIANLMAIPLISLITFPAIVMMMVMSFLNFSYLTIWLGMMADLSLSGLFYLLKQLSGYWLHFPSQYYWFGYIGWLVLIVHRINVWQQHKISLLLIFLLMLSPAIKQRQERWQLDMLDVGHGLAIVIRSGNSAILYDTGAKWQNSSAAERIIVPFLKWHNLSVEGIIISHEHNDHIGGLDTIKKYYPDAWLMSSSSKLNNNYICVSGNKLDWQGLTLSILWPNEASGTALNAESCVVQISDGVYTILLTGDLEKQQEQQLILHKKQLLSSTILQIPHHASNSSSHYAFLSNVSPKISLGSTSRYNPWKLPANKVLNRYNELKLTYYLTSYFGQISILFYSDELIVKTMRNEIKPRWYHDWFGALPN
ncbi:DNA internalization-related competence protein ComEC/Rec2 [Orbus sturtevantii]|uniref:DNA internalization-related competence protein ComEC/Rec2 n=1 Tax=Orbus sturtevantii TaxID=3074109 RepID=UPI00370D3696